MGTGGPETDENRCRFTLDSGNQCSKAKWKRSDFCWHHAFRRSSNHIAKQLTFGLLIPALMFFLGQHSTETGFDHAGVERTAIADTASGERLEIARNAEEDRVALAERKREEDLRRAHVARERPLPHIEGNVVAIVSGGTYLIRRGYNGPIELPFHPATATLAESIQRREAVVLDQRSVTDQVERFVEAAIAFGVAPR